MKQLEIDFSELEKEVLELIKPKKAVRQTKAVRLLELKRILNLSPTKKLIAVNPQYGNKYIPYQVMKIMLNAIFESYQIVMRFPSKTIGNNEVFYMDIIVKNPITGDLQTYSGTSSVAIADKGKEHLNHQNIPAGKTFSVLNAAKEIGNIFNAEPDSHISALASYFEDKIKKMTPEVDRMLKMINNCQTISSLQKLENNVMPEAKNIYTKKYNELTQIIGIEK